MLIAPAFTSLLLRYYQQNFHVLIFELQSSVQNQTFYAVLGKTAQNI